jgi:hypothetical protein
MAEKRRRRKAGVECHECKEEIAYHSQQKPHRYKEREKGRGEGDSRVGWGEGYVMMEAINIRLTILQK